MTINKVLIFHPGGYRDIISSPGDNRSSCYKKQIYFFKKLCAPLIRNGFIPVVKVHPLRAKYHDFSDLKKIFNKIEIEEGFSNNSIKILKPNAWTWDIAFESSFVVTFGSSAVYEMWSAGIKNVYILDFMGSERSGRFNYFDSIFIKSYKEYQALINNVKINKCCNFDNFTNKIIAEYNSLSIGTSVVTTIDEILYYNNLKKISIYSIDFFNRPDVFIYYEWVVGGFKKDSDYVKYATSAKNRKSVSFEHLLHKAKKIHNLLFLQKITKLNIVSFIECNGRYAPLNSKRTAFLMNNTRKDSYIIGRIVNNGGFEYTNKVCIGGYRERLKKILPEEFESICKRIESCNVIPPKNNT